MVSSDDGRPYKRKRPRPVSPPVMSVIKRHKSKLLDAASVVSSQTGISSPDVANSISAVKPTPASVEAGNAIVQDHLEFYTTHLETHIRPVPSLLPIPAWQELYNSSLTRHGCHFVIHQHDHPIAGTHYDLRLQINETSSCSWAIMYGLPGDPNSKRLNRGAVETRIHCLWNHLIESASVRTGSLLIWDTGRYEVLREAVEHSDEETDEEKIIAEREEWERLPQQGKLARAFAKGKIKLKLHGSKLPKGYVVYIRRPRDGKVQDKKPSLGPRRRRRRSSGKATGSGAEDGAHSDDDEDEAIRRNNAYPGALNTIGSIHQRTWYASMDRPLSGFVKTRADGESIWVRPPAKPGESEKERPGFEPFHVMGRDGERSVVTGRLAKDVMTDECVVGFTPRLGWRAVTE